MAKPDKKRGFRSITVENQKFEWRFDGIVDVRPESHKHNRLKIDFGWYDKWLFVNDKENEPPDFEPKVVTPGFVSEAIRYALANDWNTDLERAEFEIEYKNLQFSVK